MVKKILAKFTNFRDEIKHLTEKINEYKKGEYENDFMKIKFNSDDNLRLYKMLKLHTLTVIVRSVLKKMVNIIHKFLDECFYEV